MRLRYFAVLAAMSWCCGVYAGSASYTYDALGRLTTAINTGAPSVSYQYDPLGNFTQRLISLPPSAPPTITASTVGIGAVTFTFTPPSTYSGAAITGYIATCSPGSLSATVSASATTVTVTGLLRGASYTCTVVANSLVGSGPPSTTQSITGGSQTISFPFAAVLISVSRALGVTASSGLPVSLTTTTPSTCTVVSGSAVRGVAAGSCNLTATQAGDSNFLAAPSVSKTLPVISPATLFSILTDD